MNTATILPVLQMILTTANICVLAYAFVKFLSKPHNTLEDRLNAHDIEIREIKSSLLQGNDRFREQDDTNEIILHSVLALIEFEMQYCITEKKPVTEELAQAKKALNTYLSKR